MSTYDKGSKPSGTGEYRQVPKDREIDSGLFTAACIVMTLGFPWVAFALAIWGVPGMWETTFLDGNHTPIAGAPSVNWGMGFLAILLTGFALYPWCYSTLFFTWAIRGKPNEARAAEQIGGIHLTHLGLIFFWLLFVGPGVYAWWWGMFGLGAEIGGWIWALFIPALILTGISIQGVFWGLFLIFYGTEGARNPSTSVAVTQPLTVVQINCGGGLSSEIWDNKDLSGEPKVSGVDPNIEINWGGGGPPGVGVDQFSIRWSGFLLPRETGSYTLETSNDDGVRLWRDGQLLIDEWYDQVGKHQATAELEAGAIYDFRMEYYENGGHAKAKLRWTKPDGTYEIVPCSVFSPTKPDMPSTVVLQAVKSGEVLTNRLNWWED